MTGNIYSVGQVNAYIKNMFAQDFMMSHIYVRGEVSNCKYHSSGHIYFTLKDRTGVLQAVMFSGSRKKGLKFRMKEGDKCVVLGSIRVYERDGKYQLYAEEILLEGAGLLYQRFEALKRELEEMGMFAPEYKQPIPRFASRVGVVTAPTGAAVRDIQNISRRRNPFVQVILYPAQVQGEGAAASIVSGIHALTEHGVDVIIVGRGGGSIEDLWAFNEESVARAIFGCPVPVISAVGHETDFTIADFVADLRAPTPSAAAELAVYDYRQAADQMTSAKLAFKPVHQPEAFPGGGAAFRLSETASAAEPEDEAFRAAAAVGGLSGAPAEENGRAAGVRARTAGGWPEADDGAGGADPDRKEAPDGDLRGGAGWIFPVKEAAGRVCLCGG